MIERFPELETLSPSEKLTLASELWDQVASNPGQIPATLEQMAELKAKILAGNLGDRAGEVEAEAPNANIIELLEKRLSDYLAEPPSAQSADDVFAGLAEHKKVDYLPEFLAEIAESANLPAVEWDQHAFAGRDGWQVHVFYDVGHFDYLEGFTSPEGEYIDLWDDPLNPLFEELRMNWRPKSCS